MVLLSDAERPIGISLSSEVEDAQEPTRMKFLVRFEIVSLSTMPRNSTERGSHPFSCRRVQFFGASSLLGGACSKICKLHSICSCQFAHSSKYMDIARALALVLHPQSLKTLTWRVLTGPHRRRFRHCLVQIQRFSWRSLLPWPPASKVSHKEKIRSSGPASKAEPSGLTSRATVGVDREGDGASGLGRDIFGGTQLRTFKIFDFDLPSP